MSKMDQAKLVMQMRKVQKQLSKLIVEVEAGDGAVRVQMTGEQKVKDVTIDPARVDTENIGELEGWLRDAFRDAIQKSQSEAAEKMKPFMGSFGNLG